MLPPWLNVNRRELTVLIRSNNLVVRQFTTRYFKHVDTQQQTIALKNTVTENDIESGYLTGVLANVFGDEKWRSSAVNVVLSNYFSRYVVVPWNQDIFSAEERASYLQHSFIHAFGHTVAGWNKAQSAAEYGKNALGSAFPQSLMQCILAASEQTQVTLNAVQPYLMHVINQALEMLDSQEAALGFWLVVVSDGRLCILFSSNNQWHWVMNTPMELNIEQQINTLIQRELLLNEMLHELNEHSANAPILLHWPDKPSSRKISIAGFRVVTLETAKIFADMTMSHPSQRWVMS